MAYITLIFVNRVKLNDREKVGRVKFGEIDKVLNDDIHLFGGSHYRVEQLNPVCFPQAVGKPLCSGWVCL
jgi:hypothetical protein